MAHRLSWLLVLGVLATAPCLAFADGAPDHGGHAMTCVDATACADLSTVPTAPPTPTTPADPTVPGVPSVPATPTAPPSAPAPATSPLRLRSDGTVAIAGHVPKAIRAVIHAGNHIATKPYKWGGGHGDWTDSGYDCSGSVSYVLHAAGLLDAPLVSGSFERWGGHGKGSWITIYATAGHVWMVVAGMRFDTSEQRGSDSRWQTWTRGTHGFVIRHPAGL